ncbi:hypothetical protein N180_03335 [Pedobacter antarcticus 4BY]|uniref:DUF2059 domain-containing protein n=2 Tax=Pedobacter antarcticus TaxID=34086 RepID=A0A081PKR8_9SPHI|nr:DUF2059 domain-containing protein [Pedobacter antarcticus]KEQ31291.1 hypothetical protein N180_03335 [Pedobacter antarcticus 4BY]SFE57598.1 hypothetical protein SAMN03003324_00952 [Pedobacter antarcticus]
MKTPILTLLLLLSATVTFGQENSTYRASLKKMMQVSGSEVAYKGVINQMITMFKEKQSNVPKEFWDEVAIEMNKDALNQLINLVLPIYQKHLTEDDLTGVIAFYDTPVGKKFAEKTPVITQESMIAGQEWDLQIGQQVIDKLRNKGYLKD